MAVRPPQDDDTGPETIEFGIAALAARLDDADVAYPATTNEIVEAVDDDSVPYDAAGNTVGLGEAFERVPGDRFESQSELLDALHPVFEEYRANASAGLLAQLRALLPI